MDRRQFLVQSSLVTAGAMLPLNKLFAAKPGNFNTLRRNVGFFTEQGGTIGWLASKDALVMVDSEFPDQARHCLTGLQEKTSHPMDLLINTHHHGDHTAGNPVIKPVAQKTVAHENVPVLMKKAAKQGDNKGDLGLPESTYSDSWKMDVGDEIIHANYYGRGHTAGDSIIYFEKANVVHMGDLVFNRMNPYTDRPNGASIHNWIKALSAAEETYPDDAIFIFGHGKPEFGVTGKKEDLGVMKSYFTALVEYVDYGIEAGKSKEEIIDQKVMKGFENFLYADFWSLSQNLEVVYAESTGKKWLEI